MKIIIIITGIVLLYGIFSTFFHEVAIVGDIGKVIGEHNLYIFGHLAYINIPLLLYPLYLFYTNKHIGKPIDFYLGWVFGFIGLITFEALVFGSPNAGYIGVVVIHFLEPLIGIAGLWLLWIMIVLLTFVLVLEDNFSVLFWIKERLGTQSTLRQLAIEHFDKAVGYISTHPFASPSIDTDVMPKIKTIDFETKPRFKTTEESPKAPKVDKQPMVRAVRKEAEIKKISDKGSKKRTSPRRKSTRKSSSSTQRGDDRDKTSEETYTHSRH
ncbi:MAG: DNA translocase FtsK 4TM domain-containing protein [Sulfurovum sp.]|nr:DNA translocase FtsK 4TM domain-containing protein [Sulfurovum sp.]